MDLKISFNYYMLLKFCIWIFYAFLLLNVVYDNENIEIICAVFLCGLLVQMTIITFVNNWYKLRKPLLLDWFRLTTFFVIILNFFSIVQEFKFQKNFDGYVIKSDILVQVILVIFIGLLGLKMGHFVSIYLTKKKYKLMSFNQYEFRNVYIFYFLTVLLVGMQFYLMFTGKIGFTGDEDKELDFSIIIQIVSILSNSILSLYAIFKYLFSYKHKFFNFFYFTYFTVQIFYGFLLGMKESVIVPVVLILIPFLFDGRKIAKKYIALGIICLLLIYPLNNNYRGVIINFPNMDRQEALGIALVQTISFGFFENLNQGGDDFSNRLSLFPYLAYSVDKEQEWNYYKNLDRYIYLPISWILPRSIIPDKPVAEIGGVLNEKIFFEQGRSTSLTPTTYGWAYYEGGFFYVFILFTLFGFVISAVEKNLNNKTLLGFIVYNILLVTLLKVESDIYFLVSGVFQILFVNFLLIKFLVKKVYITTDTN
jgi:hypothetical protein